MIQWSFDNNNHDKSMLHYLFYYLLIVIIIKLSQKANGLIGIMASA